MVSDVVWEIFIIIILLTCILIGLLTALVSIVDISLYLATVRPITFPHFYLVPDPDCLQPKPYHICKTPKLCLKSTSTNVHSALSFLMPKLYSNTVLSSLNARRKLRQDAVATVDCGSRSTTTQRVSDN